MRFKTFRLILISSVAVAGLSGLLAASTCCKKQDDPKPEPAKTAAPVVKPVPVPTPTINTTATTTATTGKPVEKGDGLALRPNDQKIIDLFNKPATSDKLKDAVPGAWKVNIYRENGATKFNRAKIDLNRNEKWDEKWSMDDNNVLKRQVAPNDDENYTLEYFLKDGQWVSKKP